MNIREKCIEAMEEAEAQWPINTLVRKRRGSWWEGRVVGYYSTKDNPHGLCVQLDRPNGPVQIYPAEAMERVVE